MQPIHTTIRHPDELPRVIRGAPGRSLARKRFFGCGLWPYPGYLLAYMESLVRPNPTQYRQKHRYREANPTYALEYASGIPVVILIVATIIVIDDH